MRIGIGTTNPAKIQALTDTLERYPAFRGAEVESVDASASAGSQPRSLEHTLEGARERAVAAQAGRDLGFGIESGVFDLVLLSDERRMFNVCACALFDGARFCYGLSPGFVVPPVPARLVRQGEDGLNHAFFRLGLTGDLDHKRRSGIVGSLTDGRMDRSVYTSYAIMMALAEFEHPDLYKE